MPEADEPAILSEAKTQKEPRRCKDPDCEGIPKRGRAYCCAECQRRNCNPHATIRGFKAREGVAAAKRDFRLALGMPTPRAERRW